MRSHRFTTLLFLLTFCTAGLLSSSTGYGQQSSAPAPAAAPAAAPSMPAVQSMSPDAIQSELQKAGITLTPAEIQQGKELLEQQKTQVKP